MSHQAALLAELEASADTIAGHFRASDHDLIAGAKILAAIKKRFGRRRLFRPNWREWSTKRFSLGESRIRQLVRIGKAPDPRAELERQRAVALARQRRLRTGRLAERMRRIGSPAPVTPVEQPAPVRNVGVEAQRLIDWAQAAPTRDVRQVLAFVKTLTSSNAGGRAQTGVTHAAPLPNWVMQKPEPQQVSPDRLHLHPTEPGYVPTRINADGYSNKGVFYPGLAASQQKSKLHKVPVLKRIEFYTHKKR